MSQVLICCPHCEYRKEFDQSKIPTTAQRVKCPRCKQAFDLAAAISPLENQPEIDVPILTADEVAATIKSPIVDAADEELTASVAVPLSPPPPVEPRPPVPPRPPVEPREINFVFHGTAKEYFGIWIVNTLLKIVTLGIYTPWAKVRKRSYFYGCTQLDGMNFDYLANPIALLKGWLLGAVLFLLYSLGANFSPILSMVIGALVFILMPWVIVRSRLFNNRNSAHRNIRFNFYPDYKGAYFAYLLLPLLTPLTLGLLTPYMLFRQKQFLVGNNSFGKTPFKFFATSKDYYLLCLRGLGLVVLLVIGGFAMFGSLLPMLQGLGSNAGAAVPLLAFVIPFVFISGYLLVVLYYYVRLTNLTWNSTRLGKHRFTSNLKVLEICWIFFSSGLAIIISFGLLTPWATIRLTRYRLQNMSVIAHGDLEEFETANRADVSAAAEEIGDIFGMDIGL